MVIFIFTWAFCFNGSNFTFTWVKIFSTVFLPTTANVANTVNARKNHDPLRNVDGESSVSKAVFAKPLSSISPKTLCVTTGVVREKMSAGIKTKEAWDFVQLTFNLDTINWRWRMRAVECKVDYSHSESQTSEAGCQLDSDLAEKQLPLNAAF